MDIEYMVGQVGIGGVVAIVLVLWLTKVFNGKLDNLTDSNCRVISALVGPNDSVLNELRSLKIETIRSMSSVREEIAKLNGKGGD